jgi:hypothetical protein
VAESPRARRGRECSVLSRTFGSIFRLSTIYGRSGSTDVGFETWVRDHIADFS